MMTEAQALKKLHDAVAKAASQREFAAKLGISAPYLNDVLLGRRGPAAVLERFGLKRIVRYEEAKP